MTKVLKDNSLIYFKKFSLAKRNLNVHDLEEITFMVL